MNDFSELKKIEIDYHIKQWDSPYRSTIFFYEFVKESLKKSKKVIDLGCGIGSSTYYISNFHAKCEFIGIDYSKKYINIGNDIIKSKNINNLELVEDDCFNLNVYDKINGVISLQTLSFLPEFERPLKEVFVKLNPEWIAISSLFYEGDITIKSKIIQKEKNPTNPTLCYNTYSIPSVDKYCRKNGYKIHHYTPFEIDIDIDKPDDIDQMNTYTIKTFDNARLQISGPLLMNWYFILIKKI